MFHGIDRANAPKGQDNVRPGVYQYQGRGHEWVDNISWKYIIYTYRKVSPPFNLYYCSLQYYNMNHNIALFK